MLRRILACVASVSSRGSSRKLGQEQKKRNEGGGGGERRNRLPANPTILKNCVRPRTQLLIGSVRVVLITEHSKHQSNHVYFFFSASQIWSHLICGRRLQMLWTDIFLESCLCEGLWDQSLQSMIGDRAVETREEGLNGVVAFTIIG